MPQALKGLFLDHCLIPHLPELLPLLFALLNTGDLWTAETGSPACPSSIDAANLPRPDHHRAVREASFSRHGMTPSHPGQRRSAAPG